MIFKLYGMNIKKVRIEKRKKAVLEYSSSIEDYLSLTDEEFQSKKIMIETKLDVEKVKITLFISVILVAFLAVLGIGGVVLVSQSN